MIKPIIIILLSFTTAYSQLKFDFRNFNIGASGNIFFQKVSVLDQGGLIDQSPFFKEGEPQLSFYVGYDLNRKHRFEMEYTTFSYYITTPVNIDPNRTLSTSTNFNTCSQFFINYKYFLMNKNRFRLLKNFKLSIGGGIGFESLPKFASNSRSTGFDEYGFYNSNTNSLTTYKFDYETFQEFNNNFLLNSQILLEYLLFKNISLGVFLGYKIGFQKVYSREIMYKFNNIDYNASISNSSSGYFFGAKLTVYFKNQKQQNESYYEPQE